MKPLLPIFGLFLIATGAGAQQPARIDTSQHFLWFTGHWSQTKKNVFIPVGGGTVTIGGDGSVQLKTGGIDDWNKKIDQAGQSEQQFIQQLDNPQDNLEPSTHQLYQLLKPDAEQRKQDFQDLRIDPKRDVMSPETKPGQSAAPTPARPDAGADNCNQLKADYDQVIGWWKAHAKGKSDNLPYPPPPAFEYNCYACDSNIRNNYQSTIDNYVRDFFHPEDNLIRKGLGIMKQMGFSLQGGESGPCNSISSIELAQAVNDIALHAFLRADKMMRDNRKNFKAASAIAKTWLTGARSVALLTGSTSMEEGGFAELSGIFALAVDYYYNELKKNDWRQIGNLTFMLGLMRGQSLVAGHENSLFDEYLARLLKVINGFKLTIEMDVKIGKDGGYRLAHLKGEGHVIPAFQRDSNQCYKWQVAQEDRQDGLGFLMPSQGQTIDCQLIDNEMIFPPQAPKWVYTGTRKYTASLQNLSMDFCNPGHDTIELSGFSPKPASAGTWQIPYSPPQNLGVVGMEQYFEDVMAKKKLADDGEAQQAAGQMQQQGEALKKQMEALKSQMSGPQGGVSYEKMMELMNKSRQIASSPVIGKMLWLDFLIPVQNNTTVLVDKRYDAKEINPEMSSIVVYGYYTIHIENTGNGKPKTATKPSPK